MSEALDQKIDRDPATQFKSKLGTILYTPVTVENISRFADDALEQLIALNEAVVARYQKECEEAEYYDGEELEDEAYKHYDLENLNTVLTRISEVRDAISAITVYVSGALEQSSTVITPPDPTGPVLEGSGRGTYEAPRKLGRLVTLAYILERDFNLDHTSIRYVQGNTTDSMLRKEPYVRVEIEDLNRIVYVCDEEGNASYVFNTEVLEHLGITPIELDQMSKNNRNALLRITPTAGRRIIQTPEWRSVMATALREPFAETKSTEPMTHSLISEFAERPRFLPFDEFVTEVRKAYEAAGSPTGTQNWYNQEYKNHKGWPSAPYVTYKEVGWEGYQQLIGKEVVKLLEFSDFMTKATKAYEAAGSPNSVVEWYKNEFKKQTGWPLHPERVYASQGWKSYPELVGREVIEFLEYADFVNAVREAYEAAGSPRTSQKWYAEEYKKQRGWPAGPHLTYKNKGWKSFPELVGKK